MKLSQIILIALTSSLIGCTEQVKDTTKRAQAENDINLIQVQPFSQQIFNTNNLAYNIELQKAIKREKEGLTHTLLSYERAIQDLRYASGLKFQDENIKHTIINDLQRYERQLATFKQETQKILKEKPSHPSLVGNVRIQYSKDLPQAVYQAAVIFKDPQDTFHDTSARYAAQRRERTIVHRQNIK